VTLPERDRGASNRHPRTEPAPEWEKGAKPQFPTPSSEIANEKKANGGVRGGERKKRRAFRPAQRGTINRLVERKTPSLSSPEGVLGFLHSVEGGYEVLRKKEKERFHILISI